MRRSLTFWPVAAVALMLFSACEEAVNPILESDRNYTMFGTLDMEQDTQYVRVERIRETLDAGDPSPLGVRFTSTDLETGAELEWRDSLVTFSDGSVGHVFYTPLRVIPGHRYRIEIEDAVEPSPTWAETTVPEIVEPVVNPEEVQGGAGGVVGSGMQQILWQNLTKRPFRVDSWYRFMVADRTPFVDVVLPYEPASGPGGDAAWQVTLDLRKDRLTLDTLVQVRETPLVGLGLTLTVLDEAFVPPGGVFDPEVLVQPGTFSNVQNGFGFIGSVARYSVEWVLSEDSMNRLGYQTLGDIFGKRADDVRREILRLASERAPHRSNHPGLQ